jgi:hypothetical protein
MRAMQKPFRAVRQPLYPAGEKPVRGLSVPGNLLFPLRPVGNFSQFPGAPLVAGGNRSQSTEQDGYGYGRTFGNVTPYFQQGGVSGRTLWML